VPDPTGSCTPAAALQCSTRALELGNPNACSKCTAAVYALLASLPVAAPSQQRRSGTTQVSRPKKQWLPRAHAYLLYICTLLETAQCSCGDVMRGDVERVGRAFRAPASACLAPGAGGHHCTGNPAAAAARARSVLLGNRRQRGARARLPLCPPCGAGERGGGCRPRLLPATPVCPSQAALTPRLMAPWQGRVWVTCSCPAGRRRQRARRLVRVPQLAG